MSGGTASRAMQSAPVVHLPVPLAKLEPTVAADGATISRPRLVDALLDPPRPVCLVHAQAGAGKSLLLHDVYAELRRADQAVAWLQLDSRDNGAVVLWNSLLAALRRALPDTGMALQGFVPPNEGPDPGFLSGVVTALEALEQDLWLIIDDLHEVTSTEVLETLDWFLRHQPGTLRVIISSRGDTGLSLSRLRLSGRLTELGAEELAFRPEEIRDLFAARGLVVDDGLIAQLHERTGGWAVAIQIVALAIAGADAAEEAIARLSGDNRQMAAYVGEEILRRLPASTRRFLLETSIVRRLGLELAEMLSGRSDAGAVLDGLVAQNLLTVRAPVEGSGYRYHELLRSHLQTELRRTDRRGHERLHARAARWYRDADEPLDALHHARRARDTLLILSLLDRYGLSLLLTGHQPELVLPDDLPRAVTETTLVRLLQAETALRGGSVVEADGILATLQTDEPGDSGPAERPRIDLPVLEASVRLHRARFGGDLDRALATVRAVGGGETGDQTLDLYTLQHRGAAELYRGRYAAAREDLERALELASAGGARHAEVANLGMLSWAACGMSDLAGMRRFAEHGLELAAERGWSVSPIAASAHLGRAAGAYLDADPELVRSHADLMRACLEGRADPTTRFTVQYAHAVQDALFGTVTPRVALERIRAGWQEVAGHALDPVVYALGVHEEIRLALSIGAVDWAEEAAARIAERLPESGEHTLARALILRSSGLVRQAEQRLRAIVTGHTSCASVVTLILAWLQTAELALHADRPAAALDALAAALRHAVPQGVLLPFLRLGADARELLATHAAGFGHADHTHAFVTRILAHPLVADTGGVSDRNLTATEREVLRGLATSCTLSELADARGVSVNTVKAHVRSVYRKLEVGKRRDAVSRARSEGLL